ncbi:MAG TPA: acyl-CoA dehydratase activase [Planctomycetota bacterium]|nr:acyl-CoA dehydratase activase [Planctomycetota bacterium]HUV38792.1 acyl-CoA dehydratase activase [Planctomycetota bacterium]
MSGLFAGIDVGSTTTKAVLLRGEEVVTREISATGASARRTAREVFERALAAAGCAEGDVAFVMSTGYGRRMVEFRTDFVSEITANAWGARFLARDAGAVRTIVDVGGQDSKAIALDDDGRVTDFAMNDKCAAGTGRFLEVMARILEMDLDGMSEAALSAARAEPITSLCTVFAESEVVGLVSEGKAVAEIVSGVHEAVAGRIGALVRRVGLRTPVFFDGGAALNGALRRALERNLDTSLIVPEHPQFVAAVGAALVARERAEGANEPASKDDG